jgi:hypothetical protein
MAILKPVKKIEKEIMFLHSFVENAQRLSDLAQMARKNKELIFSVAKFFASGGEIREWKTGLISKSNKF